MTRNVGFARAGVCAIVLISVCSVAGSADGLSISPRYASPAGSGTACTQANPCGIVEAINNAPSADEVTIEPGTYGSPGSPITTELTASDVHVHGQSGAANPVVYVAAGPEAMFLGGNTSTLSHLTVVSSGSAGGVLVFGNADHLTVLATAAFSYACAVFGDQSDSLCVDTGTQGAAVELEHGGGDETVSLDNVTAIATAGAGILADTGSSGSLTVAATDTIARGAQADTAVAADSGCTTEVDFAHSAYRPASSELSGPGTVSVVNQGGNVSADPKFVNANVGDYREAAGSPTIDKGLRRIGHPTDLAGNPRNLGKTTDIGAYEFLPKPRVGKIHVSHKTAHSLTVKVPVNPEGLATAVRLVARHGHTHKTSHRVLAGNGTENTSIALKVHGLKPGTKYDLVVKASNDGGTTSHNKSATTKGKPKHKHHHHSRA